MFGISRHLRAGLAALLAGAALGARQPVEGPDTMDMQILSEDPEKLVDETVEMLMSLTFPGSLSGGATEEGKSAQALDFQRHEQMVARARALLGEEALEGSGAEERDTGVDWAVNAAEKRTAFGLTAPGFTWKRELYKRLLRWLVVDLGAYEKGADERFAGVWDVAAALVWLRFLKVCEESTPVVAVPGEMPAQYVLDFQKIRFELLQAAGTADKVDDRWVHAMNVHTKMFEEDCKARKGMAALEGAECEISHFLHALVGLEMHGGISMQYSELSWQDNKRTKYGGYDEVIQLLVSQSAMRTVKRLGVPGTQAGAPWALDLLYMRAVGGLLKQGAFNQGVDSRLSTLLERHMKGVFSAAVFLDLKQEDFNLKGPLRMPAKFKTPFYKMMVRILRSVGSIYEVRDAWVVANAMNDVAFRMDIMAADKEFSAELLRCYVGIGLNPPSPKCVPMGPKDPRMQAAVKLALQIAEQDSWKGRKKLQRALGRL